MRLFLLLLVVGSIHGLPAKREQNSKLSRQEPLPAAPVKTDAKPVQKVAMIDDTETGSVAPVGDLVVGSKPPTTTVKTFVEGESLSSPNPFGDINAPPPPKVALPTINVTGFTYPESVQPPRRPLQPRPPTTTPAPSTTTKKTDEDDSSSEEEENEEGPNQGGPGGPNEEDESPAENEQAEGDEQEEGNKEEDTTQENEEEEEEEEEEDEEAEDEAAAAKRRDALQMQTAPISEQEPSYVEISTDPQDFSDVLSDPKMDAYIPGYISPNGEVFVPIDTLDNSVPYTIIPDKQAVQGRLLPGIVPAGVARQGVPQEDSPQEFEDVEEEDDDESVEDEEEEEADDDDNNEDEDAEDDASDSEEDETVPVRVSSFNIIYKQKKKTQEAAAEEEGEGEGGEETKTEGGSEETEGPAPGPSGGPRPVNSKPPEGALTIGVKSTSGNAKQPTEADLNRRPPPLAFIPATKPTNEDDEDEFHRRFSFRGLFPYQQPYPYYLSYPSSHEEPSQEEYYGYYD